MNPNNLTIKTQEVISNAQMLAMRNQNQQLDTLHMPLWWTVKSRVCPR